MENHKYKLSLLSMFKNESMIIEEWLQHYISEGVAHFYLIDNGSTDNYETKISKFNNKISLVKDKERHANETQPMLFNKHFLDIIKKESEWIIIADMDEYIYSRKGFQTLSEYFLTMPSHIDNIVLPWKNFGSSNIISQPESIKSGFISCEDPLHFKKRITENFVAHCKSITKTSSVISLNVHECNKHISNKYFSDFSLITNNLDFYDINKQYIHLNHYQHMSKQYYNEVKIKRGDAQTDSTNNYHMERYIYENTFFNKVNDYELAVKNYKITNPQGVALKIDNKTRFPKFKYIKNLMKT